MKGFKKLLLTGIAVVGLAYNAGCASISRDVGTYRNYAREQSSTEVGDNVKDAGKSLVGVGEGVLNTTTLAYGTDKYEHLRENDGKNPLYHANEAGKSLVESVKDAGLAVYSLGDVVTLGLLPNLSQEYGDTVTLMRPFRFLGRGVCNSVDTIIETANAPTFGLANNLTGSVYGTLKEGVESLKYLCQGLTNLAIREPTRLVTGGTPEKALDWVCLVPWEWASNTIEFEGFGNMNKYDDSIENKGHFGSLIEFLGDAWLTYEALSGGDGKGVVEEGPGPTPEDPTGPFF